jgi:hypothetical protein
MQRFSCLLLVFSLMLSLAGPVQAQKPPSRFGLGFQVLASTASGDIGPGLHFRASTPINSDFSLAVGSGLTGFIFGGRENSAFAFDPQVSGIVSFSISPDPAQSTYILGGVGAYVPFGNTDTGSGPTFNLGVGRVWLLDESSLFVEFNPGFLIGEDSTTLIFPIRAGIIL